MRVLTVHPDVNRIENGCNAPWAMYRFSRPTFDWFTAAMKPLLVEFFDLCTTAGRSLTYSQVTEILPNHSAVLLGRPVWLASSHRTWLAQIYNGVVLLGET